MKATPRGSDFLQAIIVLSLLALILDVNALLALGFTLAVIALITASIIASISSFNTKLTFEPPRLGGFKGDTMTTTVIIALKRARWITVSLSKIDAPPGVEASFVVLREDLVSLSLRTSYAGRFEGLLMHLEVRDVLNLFSKEIQTVYADFVLESFPVSLLAAIPHSKPMPLTLGDRSARSQGSSLELYALEQFQPFSETKNLLWKRVARMPDEQLIVRVRESSIPKTIRVGFIQRADRFEDVAYSGDEEKEQARLRWADLVCEGVGAVGNNLLAVGCNLEIIHTSRKKMIEDERQKAKTEDSFVLEEGVAVHYVEDMADLSSTLMKLWDLPWNGREEEKLFEVLAMSDVVVCGMRELSNATVARAVARKPALIISEENADPVVIGTQTVIYSGTEDVKKLVSTIIER